jgi:hypothetical protein
MLCSQSINAIGKVDVWCAKHLLEERFSDIENNDFDGDLPKADLFTASLSLVEQKLFFEKNSKRIQLTSSFIRAPPKDNFKKNNSNNKHIN